MARLTKDQTRRLRKVLADAEAVRDYIMGERVRVCRVEGMATTTQHYVRADGEGDALYPVSRSAGSDLCRIETAIQGIADFLVYECYSPRPRR